ncbi:SAM-dependent methyltransferase [Coralloluteibacterium stylophorae]|uniref:Methyltransferase domain-containing protein n=1 Tax=Coralloluteibacterium stylophorae TaxID=1776034 RepID=A0A8J8AWY8_9GAMM|nr:SAM-dependent methyltransferase [Coralloluteibacterium stylophorae]MBS7457005.1 methyltransferase domain-containing protein [Coralloluteibacterium stylophorae]
MSAQVDFDALYAAEDPWGYRTRWYEARKRALTLAALDRPRFARACELGCSIGELAAELAPRCTRLLATDAHPQAVARARRRLQGRDGVEVLEMRHPERLPDGRFDLVVVSEIGYYLDAGALDRLAAGLRERLADDALVLACHWRPPIDGCSLDGDQVHARLDAGLHLSSSFLYVDHDLRLQGWSVRRDSVARREGLR